MNLLVFFASLSEIFCKGLQRPCAHIGTRIHTANPSKKLFAIEGSSTSSLCALVGTFIASDSAFCSYFFFAGLNGYCYNNTTCPKNFLRGNSYSKPNKKYFSKTGVHKAHPQRFEF